MKIIKKIALTLGVTIAFAVISSNPSKALTAVRVTTDDLNLRQKASTDSSVYTTLSKGDECTFIEEEGDWYKVEYGYYTGYLSKEYAELVNYDENGEETDNENNKDNEDSNNSDNHQGNSNQDNNNPDEENQNNDNHSGQNENNQTGKMAKNDRVRILPLINSTVLQTLNKETKVTIITETNGWYYIATDTISAWVRKDSVQLEKQTSGTTNTNPQGNDKQDDNNQGDNKQDNQPADEQKDNDTQEDNTQEKTTMYVNDSYVNIRKEPSTSSEVLMVLELNTKLTVIGEQGDWYKVETSMGEAYISKELLSKNKVTSSRGSNRTLAENTNTMTTKSSGTSNASLSTTGMQIVDYAKKFLGVPYVYGGASPSGFDCSGFTMYVFDHFGINMAHGAQNQAELGTVIKTDKNSKNSLITNLRAGDLVFFLDYETMDEIGHCGIYIGEGKFIHASSGTGYCVKIDSLLPGEYYNTRYCAARRIV